MKYTNALIILCITLLSQSVFSMGWHYVGETTEKAPQTIADTVIRKYNITDSKEKNLLRELEQGREDFPIRFDASLHFYDAASEIAQSQGNDEFAEKFKLTSSMAKKFRK